jgi:rubrerythrin
MKTFHQFLETKNFFEYKKGSTKAEREKAREQAAQNRERKMLAAQEREQRILTQIRQILKCSEKSAKLIVQVIENHRKPLLKDGIVDKESVMFARDFLKNNVDPHHTPDAEIGAPCDHCGEPTAGDTLCPLCQTKLKPALPWRDNDPWYDDDEDRPDSVQKMVLNKIDRMTDL